MDLNKEESIQADAILDILIAHHLNMSGDAFNNEFKKQFDPHSYLTKLLKLLDKEKKIDVLFAEFDPNYWGLKSISITDEGLSFRKVNGGYIVKYEKQQNDITRLEKTDKLTDEQLKDIPKNTWYRKRTFQLTLLVVIISIISFHKEILTLIKWLICKLTCHV